MFGLQSVPMSEAGTFDRAYYQRFYLDPKTRVLDRAQVKKLGNFACSYVSYLDLSVRRVLDMGCGVGHWKAVVRKHFPQAAYQGVEFSSYLCERYGWEQGSVVDYREKTPFDFVICQGVLPYLDARAAKQAIANLGALCRGALYLEAVTQEDWDQGVVDKRRTDRNMQFHPARFYRRALDPHFISLGGGVWLSRAARVPTYALERA